MNQPMGSSKMRLKQPLFFLLIMLAIFGLIYQLISDPLGLFSTVIVIVLVLAAFYGIYRYAAGERTDKSAPTADKLAQIKVFHHPAPDQRKSIKKPRRKEYPFKVIEGNKDKKRRSLH